jgi:hypothetical protein
MQPGATGHGDRTVEERSTASAESGKDSTGSRLDETQEDRADHSSTRPVSDAADATGQRTRRDAATTEITQPSSDSISTVQDASDRLPADLREKMLQDPVFTRLGWGAGDDADSEEDDDSTLDEPVQVRSSADTEQGLLEQRNADNDRQAAGDATRAEDAKRPQADDVGADEQAVEPTQDESSGTVRDAEVPIREGLAARDRSLDETTGASGTTTVTTPKRRQMSPRHSRSTPKSTVSRSNPGSSVGTQRG